MAAERAPLPVLVILVAGLALRLAFVGGPQMDYDEGVYWESLRALSAGHGLFQSTYSSQPPAFLLIMSAFYAALGHSLAAARAGVVVLSIGGIAATYQVVKVTAGTRAGLVAGALLAIDPLFLKQSVTLESDGPAVAIGVVAIALTATAGRRSGGSATAERLLGGAVLATAVLTKLFAVALIVPSAAVLLMPLGERSQSRPLRAAFVPSLEVAAGAVVALAAFLLPFSGSRDALWSQAVGMHLAARSLGLGGLTADLERTLAGEAPLILAAAAGLVVSARRSPRYAVFLLAWAISVVTILVFQRPLWPHHLVLVTALLAMAAAPAITALAQPRSLWLRSVSTAGLVVVALVWASVGAVTLGRSANADTLAARMIAARTQPADLVVTDDQFAAALADRDTPPELVDTSFVRILSESVTASEWESVIQRYHVRAVYFGTGRLDRIPGLRAWVAENFAQQVDIGSGRTLFVRASGSASPPPGSSEMDPIA
jgi:4-amino-4-deoxy-L-arabinose transferase-like glycosyltransferase